MDAINELVEPPIPLFSTQAIPGSQEKIEAMRLRAEQGFGLFHPEDRVCFTGVTGARKNHSSHERQFSKWQTVSLPVVVEPERYEE